MSKPTLTIFKNDNAGKPVIRNGQPVVYNGKEIINSDLNGKISLPEGLPAGDYEVNIYKKVSKAGANYYSGMIKPAFKKKEVSQHQKDKANGYQSEAHMEEDCPF